ncbi:MAG: flagellin [Phycisphaerae bacterium]
MSRINTNIPSMVGARILAAQNASLNQSLTRLSTGLRINSGRDDPAGLIASEDLRAEKVAITSAIDNAQRAANIVSVAEGGLDEVNKLLNELEGLIDRSSNDAGISSEERDANQLQIDAILESINRIASSTEFQGRKLLSGELAYTTSAVNTTNLTSLQITSARLPNGGYRSVVVQVTASAQLGTVTFSGAATTSPATIEVTGNIGTDTISVASSTSIASVAAAVNQSKELTGVSAVVVGGTSLSFYSTQYGSDQFVQVRPLSGTFAITGGDANGRDYGVDATVSVNGTSATVQGLHASLRTATLSLDIDLGTAFGAQTLGSTTFYVTGGGADFMISPKVSLAGVTSFGIQNTATSSLGNGAVGYLSSIGSGQNNALITGNYANAQRIVRKAQDQIAALRGRLGAFGKDTLETSANALRITLENTTAAESAIRDTDFAGETSNLTRSQILVQSATNVLRLANAAPQQVLALLG